MRWATGTINIVHLADSAKN